MHRYFFAAALALAAFSAHAQTVQNTTEDTVRQLINPRKITSIGLYVAPEIGAAQFVEKDFTTVGGSSLMLLFNRRFAVGLTGFRTTDRSFSPASVAPLYLRSAFGGLRMEWISKPHRKVHLTVPLVVGRGWASVDSTSSRSILGHSHGHNGGDFYEGNRNSRSFAVIQPGLRVEANVIRFAKIFAGVDYRIALPTTSTTTTLVPENALRGMTFSAGLKLGFFDLKTKKLNPKNWKSESKK